MRTDNDTASFDWGRAIGEVRRINNEPIGSGRGTGLRGSQRASFDEGLKLGFDKPRVWEANKEKSEQSDRLRKYAAQDQREANLQWIEARHELESDEFLSARQKAEIIAKGMP